jgi:hypothetical protein
VTRQDVGDRLATDREAAHPQRVTYIHQRPPPSSRIATMLGNCWLLPRMQGSTIKTAPQNRAPHRFPILSRNSGPEARIFTPPPGSRVGEARERRWRCRRWLGHRPCGLCGSGTLPWVEHSTAARQVRVFAAIRGFCHPICHPDRQSCSWCILSFCFCW